MAIWLGWAGNLVGLGIMYCWFFGWIGHLVGLGWIGLDCDGSELWLLWAGLEIWLGLDNYMGWRIGWIRYLVRLDGDFCGLEIC